MVLSSNGKMVARLATHVGSNPTGTTIFISRLTSGEVRRLSTYSGGFDPRTRYQFSSVSIAGDAGAL